MKKLLLPLFVLITLPAFAVKINPDTQLKWNAIIVVAALHDVGLESDYGTYTDVALTYNRIMDNLLARQTFSVLQAVAVCKEQCNKSDFLKNGRGQSGRKCPEICEEFGNALVEENNKGITYIKLDEGYHPLGRVYTKDKKFYSLTGETVALSDAPYQCSDYVFESATNKKIAVCASAFGEGGASETNFKITDPKYNGFEFVLSCGNCITCDNFDEGECSLYYVDTVNRIKELQQQYEKCVSIYRGVDLSAIRTLSENPLIYGYDLKKISDNAEKIFALKNKFYGTKPDGYFSDWYLVGPLSDYCKNISVASINAMVEKAKSDIKCAKENFKTTNVFKDTQTKTLEEAREEIVRYFDNKCSGVRWSSMKCSGTCRKMPGTQDYVNCSLGDLSATFEFDDICD